MFGRYAGIADRIAVVDTETTGVYNNDRILEVAVVTLDLNGNVIDRWDTLVNARRDVGPTWIHGITPTMLADAPTFEEIADELTTRLHGAILCAHNLPFDTRMLRHEYQRLDVHLTTADGLDTLRYTGCKLAVACANHGVPIQGHAHRALHDADAVANLLLRVAHTLPPAVPAVTGLAMLGTGTPRRVTREGVPMVDLPPPPFLASVVNTVDHQADTTDVIAYLDLLDHAIEDLHLDHDERHQLAEIAVELGLTPTQIDRANRLWLSDMIAAATADGVVTEEEYDQLLLAAYALCLNAADVAERTSALRGQLTPLQLRAGMGITFTGEVAPTGHNDRDDTTFARERLESHARGLGLRIEDGLTKSRTEVLVAADPANISGKATKARQWGIPIMDARHFATLTSADQLTEAWLAVGAGREVLECPTCNHPTLRTKTKGPKPRTCGACA